MLKRIFLSLILILTFGTLSLIGNNIPIYSQDNSTGFVNNGVVDCLKSTELCETQDVSDKYSVCLLDQSHGKRDFFFDYEIICQPKESPEKGDIFNDCVKRSINDENLKCRPSISSTRVNLSPQLFSKGSQFSVDVLNETYSELKLIYTPYNSSSQEAVSSKKASSSKSFPLCPPEGCKVISTPSSNDGGHFLTPEELNKVGNTGGNHALLYNVLNIVIFILFALSILVGFISLVILIVALVRKKKFWKIALIIFSVCIFLCILSTIANAYLESLINISNNI